MQDRSFEKSKKPNIIISCRPPSCRPASITARGGFVSPCTCACVPCFIFRIFPPPGTPSLPKYLQNCCTDPREYRIFTREWAIIMSCFLGQEGGSFGEAFQRLPFPLRGDTGYENHLLSKTVSIRVLNFTS